MKMKNDCEHDCIKEAFDKLYNSVMPYIDLTQFADARTAFNELDKKVHSEIYILKKCLAESDRAVDAGLTRSEVDRKRISDLESENNAKQHVIESFVAKVNDLEKKLNIERKHGEDLADVNGQLASENADLKARLTLFEHSRITWRARAQHAEKEVEDLNKNISELEKQLAQARNSTELHLREENDRLRGVIGTLENEINDLKKKIHELEQETADDAIRIKSLERANSVLRGDNKILWSRLEEADLDISKRPWHGDGNAMTDEQASYKSLVEAIEFQDKRIEELEAEKAKLKEAYDIHETTTKKENVDLSYGHEFEFGDEVFVPWSDAPYMYVKTGLLYNTRTKTLVYVGKDQHLKWFGEKFAIV